MPVVEKKSSKKLTPLERVQVNLREALADRIILQEQRNELQEKLEVAESRAASLANSLELQSKLSKDNRDLRQENANYREETTDLRERVNKLVDQVGALAKHNKHQAEVIADHSRGKFFFLPFGIEIRARRSA